MSALTTVGNATRSDRRGARAASRISLPVVQLHLAKQADACPAPASPCKPKQPAHVVRWLVATAVLARTDRWPFPEVEPRPALSPVVRGSRASTGPRTSPDLLNPMKGLSMEKTARVFLQLAMKSVLVAQLLKTRRLMQPRPRNTVFERRYTLCEVQDGERQSVP